MLSKQIAVCSAGAVGTTLLMTWLQIRIYGILCVLALLFWLYKTRCPRMKLQVPDSISTKTQSIYTSFVKLRTDKPGAFCTIVSFILIILAIFGHIVSGQWIVLFGLIIAGFISTKHQIKIVKDKTDDKSGWSSQTTDHDVDEFMPDVNETAMFVLQRAGEEAVITSPLNTMSIDDDDDDNKSEPEIPSDLLIHDSLPEIDENSLSSLSDNEMENFDELNNAQQTERNVTSQKGAGEMNFKLKHFNPDTSSSSDDDSITRGLSFQDLSVTAVDGGDSLMRTKPMSKSYQSSHTSSRKKIKETPPTSIIPNLSGLMQGVVQNIIQTAVEQQLRPQIMSSSASASTKSRNLDKEYSDDDDDDDDYNEYEFINSEDLTS